MITVTANEIKDIPRSMLNAYKLQDAFNRISIESRANQIFNAGEDSFSPEELEQLDLLRQKGMRLLNERMSVLFSYL